MASACTELFIGLSMKVRHASHHGDFTLKCCKFSLKKSTDLEVMLGFEEHENSDTLITSILIEGKVTRAYRGALTPCHEILLQGRKFCAVYL